MISIKFPLLLLPFFLAMGAVQAQEAVEADTSGASEDSFRYKSVMIIPFDEAMYFSDSDQELARHNHKEPVEVMAMFRFGLSGMMNARIVTNYETRQILTDTAEGAALDLTNIYKSIGYHYDRPQPAILQDNRPREEPAKASMRDQLFGKEQANGNRENVEQAGQEADKYPMDEQPLERQYLNVKVHRPEMFQYLKNKYGTDLFVFLNQFELITDYDFCLDRATNNYERIIKVHYSIFDETGKQLAGNVAIVRFGSNSNDIIHIIRKNFPLTADYVAENLPAPKKVRLKKRKENEAAQEMADEPAGN